MTEDEIAELKQLAALMYKAIDDKEGFIECLEPTGDDDACPPSGCEDCGWYSDKLRDSLLRLGVEI